MPDAVVGDPGREHVQDLQPLQGGDLHDPSVADIPASTTRADGSSVSQASRTSTPTRTLGSAPSHTTRKGLLDDAVLGWPSVPVEMLKLKGRGVGAGCQPKRKKNKGETEGRRGQGERGGIKKGQ